MSLRTCSLLSPLVLLVLVVLGAIALPASELPSWQDQDLGAPPLAGGSSTQGQALTITGSGIGLDYDWHQDQGHFTSVPVSGDVEIIARISAFQGPTGSPSYSTPDNADNPVGGAVSLIMRGSTPDASGFVPMGAVSYQYQCGGPGSSDVITAEKRDLTGMYPSYRLGQAIPFTLPVWLKLTRIGNDWAGMRSSDGVRWTQACAWSGGAFRVNGAYQLGIFIAGGPNGMPAVATLDHITIAAPDRTLTSSWIGNNFSADSTSFVTSTSAAMHVSADGTVYTNTYYDEGGEAGKIYRAGQVVGHFPQPSGGGNQVTEGSVCGDDQHIYYQSCDFLIQMDLAAHYNQSYQIFLQEPLLTVEAYPQATIHGMSCGGGFLYLSDLALNQVLVVDTATLQEQPESAIDIEAPGPLACDSRGDLWILQETSPAVITCVHADGTATGRGITDVPFATDLTYDAVNDRLLVSDCGINQNVRIYTDLSTQPLCTQTLGIAGGIYAGAHPGLRFDPASGGTARLYNPHALGCDASGNIYVSCTGSWGGQTDLRCYASDGSMSWNLYGLTYVNSGDFDPASDGGDIYDTFHHFTMDWSQNAPGAEESYVGFNWNPLQEGPVPQRAGTSSSLVRRIGALGSSPGALVLFSAGTFVAEPVLVFRYAGELAIPCASFSLDASYTHLVVWMDRNGDGLQTPDEVSTIPWLISSDISSFDVDQAGDVWLVDSIVETNAHCQLVHFTCQGLDAHGSPVYSTAPGACEVVDFPDVMGSGAYNTARAHYDQVHDVMYLATNELDYNDDQGDLILARFDLWSTGNRTPHFLVHVPAPSHLYVPPYGDDSPPNWQAMDVAGDYVFLQELYGPIHTFSSDTGLEGATLAMGAEVSGVQCWEDLCMGMRVRQRRNGEYDILTENSGFRARQNLFRWNPQGQYLPRILQQPSAQSVATGHAATFTITALAVPDPSFQWQRSTDQGVTWTPIAGATSSTYVRAPVSTSDQDTEYRCLATNSLGGTPSQGAPVLILGMELPTTPGTTGTATAGQGSGGQPPALVSDPQDSSSASSRSCGLGAGLSALVLIGLLICGSRRFRG